jgi:NAD(P)-dependent dehydrogenase (short-subunit alcohol dehydrogenase family)
VDVLSGLVVGATPDGRHAGEPLAEGCSPYRGTEEAFDEVIRTNLKGAWLLMKYGIPALLRSGGGSIVNFTSIAALEAYKGIPIYSVSKGGVISMSRVAAIEYADQNIRINCIAPGTIKTPLLLGAWSDQALESFRKTTPQSRLGEPEEVAYVALFLASDASSHVVGQTIVVDGGSTARVPFSV